MDSTHPIPAADMALPTDHEAFEPRGALTFALLMLVGFALYWFYVWSIVVFERG